MPDPTEHAKDGYAQIADIAMKSTPANQPFGLRLMTATLGPHCGRSHYRQRICFDSDRVAELSIIGRRPVVDRFRLDRRHLRVLRGAGADVFYPAKNMWMDMSQPLKLRCPCLQLIQWLAPP